MTDLESLRAKALAATPGPWKSEHSYTSMVGDIRRVIPIHHEDDDGCLAKDAAYIAAANPAVVLSLIERIETMRLSLTALVNLKDHKDRCGKDEFYERHQPGVWSMAREALKAGEGE